MSPTLTFPRAFFALELAVKSRSLSFVLTVSVPALASIAVTVPVALIAFGFSDFVVVFVAVSAAKLAPLKARAVNARSKSVETSSVIFQQFCSNGCRDIVALFQVFSRSLRPVRVRIVGREHEKILANFLHDATEERFVSLATEKDPARFQIIARRMADQIPGAITGLVTMIVHPLHMGWHPADAAFEEG